MNPRDPYSRLSAVLDALECFFEDGGLTLLICWALLLVLFLAAIGALS